MPNMIKLTSTPERKIVGHPYLPQENIKTTTPNKHPKAKPLITEVTVVIIMPVFFLHQVPQATSGYVDKCFSKVIKNLCSCIL